MCIDNPTANFDKLFPNGAPCYENLKVEYSDKNIKPHEEKGKISIIAAIAVSVTVMITGILIIVLLRISKKKKNI